MSFTAILPVYLPNVSYFMPFLACDTVLFADHVQFQKRSSITRNLITENGPVLSIPVKHNGYTKAIFKKEITMIENWNTKHLKTIYHSFNTTPYFEDYFPDIENVLNNPSTSLSDFLLAFTSHFLKKLNIKVSIRKTSDLNFVGNLENELIRFAKNNEYLNYYFFQKDADTGLFDVTALKNENISTHSFPQIKSKSIAKLSVLELLFKYGPEASFIIRDLQ